jgi:hypothetical protein
MLNMVTVDNSDTSVQGVVMQVIVQVLSAHKHVQHIDAEKEAGV